MGATIITHRLDLVLRLLDTTTGKPVAAHEVSLYRDGVPLQPLEKERGILIFPGLGRFDFTLTLTARDYETKTQSICFSTLDARVPYVEVQLIPHACYAGSAPTLTLSGKSDGLQSITAIRMDDTACLIRSFDPRRRIMTLFNPHHLDLNRTHYALLNPDTQTFEAFTILKQLDDQSIKLDRVLETEFGNYFPITPLIFGMITPEGEYRLRVRDDRKSARWLLCLTGQEDTCRFHAVDFRKPETIHLNKE